jgi:hypothetical protein
MRRLLAIAILAALPAAAQIHGVPPSVTSITPSRSTPGVPASVTSLGPNGFGNPGGFGNRCCSAGFRLGSGQHRAAFRHHQHHRAVVVVPYYYSYYPTYPATYAEPPSSAEYDAGEEEPPAPTIYERRSRLAYSTGSADEDRYGEHFTDSREEERRHARAEAEPERQAAQEGESRARAETAKAEEKPEEQEPATVLVFKDGHHQEVGSYAITGDVLYDLGRGRARKILLADLDLAATTKLNDQLGNDFRLPSRPPQPKTSIF